jgi:two-component system CheB/CheR fusion protein
VADGERETSSLTETDIAALRDAFEDAPFEFWIRDLAGLCVVANAGTRRLGAILGNKPEDAPMPPDVIAAWLANNRRAYAGEVVQNEFAYGDGERKRWQHCYIVPLRIRGAIRGILGFNIDLTEHKLTEQALREVDRRRSEFLDVLSHELRNPLAVIGSGLRCLESVALGDALGRRALAAIDRQSRHLARLVDDLLDVTRIRSGKINLRHARLDLVELVRRTVEDHRELLAKRDVTVQLPDEAAWVYGDATRLAQVLGNLLANAAKFTPHDGAITVTLATAAGRAALEVADTGVGIDAASIRRLFVPFVQCDRSAEHSPSGLGLGLALVKTLVEMHDGRVTARSAGPGQGATFAITLPLVEAAPSAIARPRVDAGPPRRVLVIEDNADVAEWLALALSYSGHDVTIALDGEQGLRKARELRPEVILCDLGLPGAIDGYAVARALCQDASLATAYRVALSGYAQPEDQQRAREAGFEAHLSKPPDLDALECLLRRLRRG